MNLKKFSFALLLLFLIVSIVKSQEKIRIDSAGFNINPSITAQRCKNSGIKIDGVLNEPAWDTAPVAGNFTEISPKDNIKPPAETEMRVLYDDDNLYFAFTCYDSNISSVKSNLCDRDKIWSDDYVGVMIDTYGDNKLAYEIFANPSGIQGDATWTPTEENDSYDLIYTSEAKIYKDRWVLEIAVPFKSIRFPEKKVQSWRMHVIRNFPRHDRIQMSWAVVSRDNPSFFSQAGILTGISNVKRGKNLEILPYVIGSQNGFINDNEDPNSKFINEKFKGDLGGGIKYGFTSNLTGELVYNPDFSQVESDAAQVDVNTSSAIIYPEKRPFFLEGNNMFSTTEPIVYSRTINKPLFAAKLIGKIGGVEVGYIGALDRKTQFILPFDFGSEFALFEDLRSVTNVLRLRKVFNGDSYIGFLGTDREAEKGYNRVLSFDGSWHISNDYYFNWQVAGTTTKEINDTLLYNDKTTFGNGKYDLAFNGQKFGNIGGSLQFERQSRHWYNDIVYNDLPPETRRDVGYANSVNYREIVSYHSYTFWPDKGFFVRVNPSVSASMKFNYDGSVKERVIYPQFFIQCKELISVSGWYLAANDEYYKNVMLKGVHRGGLTINANTSNELNGSLYITAGKFIVRFGDPYVAWGLNWGFTLNLRPINRLLMENTYDYSELATSYHGEMVYAGYILRNKTSFQFTKNFFLRLVTQYDSFDGLIEIDPLISYKWNPFTIFYIGSANTLTDYGPGIKRARFIQTSRQFFAKFQYLFRF